MYDIWSYPEEFSRIGTDAYDWDLVGYSVEALDGSIGKIDEASYDAGSGYLVVDTGPWIFGKKVLLPAGVIRSVDHDSETVHVNRDKDQIKDSPEFDETRYDQVDYRDQIGTYYGAGGPAYRDF